MILIFLILHCLIIRFLCLFCIYLSQILTTHSSPLIFSTFRCVLLIILLDGNNLLEEIRIMILYFLKFTPISICLSADFQLLTDPLIVMISLDQTLNLITTFFFKDLSLLLEGYLKRILTYCSIIVIHSIKMTNC